MSKILIYRSLVEQAMEVLRVVHYKLIDAGVLDQDLLNKNFTTYGALQTALAEQPAELVLKQALTDPENQPNQFGVEFLMRGPKFAFKVGVQQFTLDYEPEEPGEFEFMRDALIHAFSTFTPDVKAEQSAEQQCEYCKRGLKAGVCYCKPAEPEPVAWGNFKEDGTLVGLSQHPEDHANWAGRKPLYTAPQPKREPLTDEEIDNTTRKQVDDLLDHIYEYGTAAEGIIERVRAIARAIERAHGIGEHE